MWSLASAMVHCRTVSLKEWADGPESVLVLQHHEGYEAALAGFERYIFGRAVSLALASANAANKATMFWLDEVRHGPFDSHLMKLATAGRGRGVGIVMGLTDISGLSDQLNPNQAEEVLGSFATQVLLGNANPKTAAWVSERLGTHQALVADATVSMTRPPEGAEQKYKEGLYGYLYPQHNPFGPGSRDQVTSVTTGKSYASPDEIERYERHRSIPGGFNAERPVQSSEGLSINIKEAERPAATKAEVMSLARAMVLPQHGLTAFAYVVSPFIGRRPTLMVTTELNHPDVTLIPAAPSELPDVERPAEQLKFAGWTQEDLARLKLLPLPKPSTRKRPRIRRIWRREQ
jgi:hypothetical protein